MLELGARSVHYHIALFLEVAESIACIRCFFLSPLIHNLWANDDTAERLLSNIDAAQIARFGFLITRNSV